MAKRKILFLGESYRADAITWITGLKEFGDFEIVTWELKTPNTPLKNRILRILEYLFAPIQINKIVKNERPDMIIAERTTSYGFLAALSNVPLKVIAQQGRTDLWPENSILLPLKKRIQRYAFKKASLIHAWGPVMTPSMIMAKVDMNKVLVLAKGINLLNFQPAAKAPLNKIHAIVTRSLLPEYRHACIIQAFGLLLQKGYDFQLTIVGHGAQLSHLQQLVYNLHIEDKVHFTGRIPNTALPNLLQQSNFYISMPITEGVSASLFEAMACHCYPIVSDIPGNQSWITHRQNGQLIPIDDYKALANELIWAFERPEYRSEAVLQNSRFVAQNANYVTNMKFIANKYHELITNLETSQKTNRN